MYHGVEARSIGCQAESLHAVLKAAVASLFLPDVLPFPAFSFLSENHFPPVIISLQPEELPL